MATIEEIKQKNVEMIIPSGWNIYDWCDKHPDTTIAHSLKRIEKIFDFSDVIQSSFSGGKDSTVSANLACLELNLRKLRVEAGIDRDGNKRIDPLDEKWKDKKIVMMMTDAEVCFSDTNNYSKRFLAKYGPEGLDLIHFNWLCLTLAWQNGCSFDSGILISWAKDKENQWVQPMPTKEELHGFECLDDDNLNSRNCVPLSSLHEDAQKYHIQKGNVLKKAECDLYGEFAVPNSTKEVDAIANFGRGPVLKNFKTACHEKEQQDDWSYEIAQYAWLTTNPDKAAIKAELEKRYDLTYDVWEFTEPKIDPDYCISTDQDKYGRVSTCLVSLRAEESLDRRVILTQGEYSTGQYSNNQGTNICSPVFDYSTNDVWRLLSATDFDVNEIYEKLFEIGVAPSDQRVGSLLNYAAVRQISTVKAIEPDLFSKIVGRFQNVEFMSQFSRTGYFRISKPKNSAWDGHNHIKAGYEPEEIAALSDRYENLLKKLEIPYERNGNEFKSADPKFKHKPWFPLRNYLKEHPEMDLGA